MAERGTKEVLLRLRRVREAEERRGLVRARASRAEARRAIAAAEVARRRLEAALGDERARRADAWPAARPAGRLARAVDFEQILRGRLASARDVERRALAALDAAEARLAAAQRALADAVHARHRSETFAASERAAEGRTRARREQAELEDRYRPPPAGRAR